MSAVPIDRSGAAVPMTSEPVGAGSGPVAYPATAATPQVAPVPPRRVARSGRHMAAAAAMAVAGALIVLVGAWAGIVPFVGALFGFSADGSGAWTWSLAHALLWLLPGAAAVVTGLFILTLASHVSSGRARLTSVSAGLVIAACGGWLVFGLSAWPVLNEGTVKIGSGSSALQFLTYQAGWTLGPGLVLVLLGACVMGLSLRQRPVNAAAAPPATLDAWTPMS